MIKINKELREEFIKKHISNWVFDDGNDKLLWKDKAPTPNEVLDFIDQPLKQQREEILTDLYRIRANIPLTTGMASREQMKELIKKLEKTK